MKILHVNKYLYRRGGAEAYMLDVAELQEQRGHLVRLWGMDHPDNGDTTCPDRLAPFMELGTVEGGAGERLRTAGRMIWNVTAERRLGALVDQWRPDVVHLHNVYHQLSPSILRGLRRRGIAMVMTLHDAKLVCPSYQLFADGEICESCIPRRFFQASRRACKDGSRLQSTLLAVESSAHALFGAYGPVQRFICPSRFLLDKMAEGRVYPDRLRHLPHFVHTDQVPGGDPAGPIVYAGRLSTAKGVADLIDAVAAMDAPPPLVIAGDGPERHGLEARAALVGSPVTFLGRIDRGALFDLVRTASVAVLPTRGYENQPMSILEASVLGVPTVASRLGGIPELIDDGLTGYLVPAADPAALAKALTAAIADPARTRQLGQAARLRAVAGFAPDRHLDALEDL